MKIIFNQFIIFWDPCIGLKYRLFLCRLPVDVNNVYGKGGSVKKFKISRSGHISIKTESWNIYLYVYLKHFIQLLVRWLTGFNRLLPTI